MNARDDSQFPLNLKAPGALAMRAEFAEIAEQMRSQPRKGFIAELAGDTLAGDPTPEGETLELPATEGEVAK